MKKNCQLVVFFVLYSTFVCRKMTTPVISTGI